ncbi:hypothetical protein [Paenibacillus pini]|uniref:Lipoprotein n=1 Tax=Paenibacillus pini JCM 16418 TaxID=1236976 RepID=W7Y6Y5_9BACL|nr:hypothetical protein [Paenibacillus pini]GAF06695.1 hypothetical protein JCM16418_668 [Paenibacillus pini JCM 16418]
MQPKTPFKVVYLIIAASIVLTSCADANPVPIKAQKNADAWPNSDITLHSVRNVLIKAVGPSVIPVAEAQEIGIEGANNKTITVNLRTESMDDPDECMLNAAQTLIEYGRLLFANKGIETVEVCLVGNPNPQSSKRSKKELVRIAMKRSDALVILNAQRQEEPIQEDQYHDIYTSASWYKVHPIIYKSLRYKGNLKMRAYKN